MDTNFIILCVWCIGSARGLPDSWPNPEFRGVWIATLANIGWPSAKNLTTEEQKAELVSILDKLQSARFNAVFLQIRPTCDTFYKSNLEPWSVYLTGSQGVAPDPFYDPLEFAIKEAHSRSLELHAWVNPYRARTTANNTHGLAPNHVANRLPQYAYTYGKLLWMDPAASEVQDFIYAVVMDIIDRYNVDGLHMDDYFYPYPLPDTEFPDEETYQKYHTAGGTLSRADWRRENVNLLVQRLSRGIQKAKPHVKFGISPFGIWKDGYPPGTKGFSAFDEVYADAKKWLNERWVDYLSPQLYWKMDEAHHNYGTMLGWWLQQNLRNRHVYAGINLLNVATGKWGPKEIVQQVDKSRSKREFLSLGNILFRSKYIIENSGGITDMLKDKLYSTPARVPAMSWKNGTVIKAPSIASCHNGTLTWIWDNFEQVKNWIIYMNDMNIKDHAWTVLDILNKHIREYKINRPGRYAIVAVNIYDVESRPEYFIV